MSCPGLRSSSSLLSTSLALQFRVVVVGSVFKVLSQYRVQQRSPLSSSSTFILVEVFKVHAQAKVQQRFLEVRRSGPPRRSLTFQFLLVFLAVFKVFLRFMMQIIVFGVVNAIIMAFTTLNRVPHRSVELIITMITELIIMMFTVHTSLLERLSCRPLVGERASSSPSQHSARSITTATSASRRRTVGASMLGMTSSFLPGRFPPVGGKLLTWNIFSGRFLVWIWRFYEPLVYGSHCSCSLPCVLVCGFVYMDKD